MDTSVGGDGRIALRILLTNDDGIHAEGLHVLCRELAADENNEVYVVAPDRNRSASSHAITLHKPLYPNQMEIPGCPVKAWSLNGTPADCAKIGVSALLPGTPDLIISGINLGSNLGIHVLYSGTVSAAIEGVVLGVPSIAVSLATLNNPDYSVTAKFMRLFVSTIAKHGNPGFRLLNINVPALPMEQINGVAVTRLSGRRFDDAFVRRTDPRGRVYYWLSGTLRDENLDPLSDAGAVKNGLISITPLQLDLTDDSLLPPLKAWVPELERRMNTGI